VLTALNGACLVDSTINRQKQPDWTGVLERPEFVVVHRDRHEFAGVLFEWRRRREPDGHIKRSARVIFLDDDKILRQSWFLEAFVTPAPAAGRGRHAADADSNMASVG
jgi:hypothetical protein